jgi:hypothetical protein
MKKTAISIVVVLCVGAAVFATHKMLYYFNLGDYANAAIDAFLVVGSIWALRKTLQIK